jgi:hypothetical protein
VIEKTMPVKAIIEAAIVASTIWAVCGPPEKTTGRECAWRSITIVSGASATTSATQSAGMNQKLDWRFSRTASARMLARR